MDEKIIDELRTDVKDFRIALIGDGSEANPGIISMLRDHDRYISDGKKYRLAVITQSFTVFVVLIAGISAYARMAEKVDWHDKYIKILIEDKMHINKDEQ